MLVLENICKSFGTKRVLNNVTMTIEPGEPIAIIGPNGSGKTTLFSIIAGFLQSDSGEVRFNNECIPCQSQFGKLAVLPQDAQLDPRFSIFKQLCFFAKLQGIAAGQIHAEVHRVLDLVGLLDNQSQKPTALSHGMRKRACIAQALIGNPELVLLDEATAGLDPLHAKEIREVIANLSSTTTFILSSHDLNELERLCQKVYVFEAGQLKSYSGDSAQDETAFVTIRLKQDAENVLALISGLPNVLHVEHTQTKEYLINYATSGEQFDLELIKVLRQHNLDYLQIYNGKTLENQLFN